MERAGCGEVGRRGAVSSWKSWSHTGRSGSGTLPIQERRSPDEEYFQTSSCLEMMGVGGGREVKGKEGPVLKRTRTSREGEGRILVWVRMHACLNAGQLSCYNGGMHMQEAANGDMAKTFHRFLGVHVGMKNEIMADNLKTWNIKSYKLHPDNRHGDKSVVMDIFGSIDKFMANKGKSCRVAY